MIIMELCSLAIDGDNVIIVQPLYSGHFETNALIRGVASFQGVTFYYW